MRNFQSKISIDKSNEMLSIYSEFIDILLITNEACEFFSSLIKKCELNLKIYFILWTRTTHCIHFNVRNFSKYFRWTSFNHIHTLVRIRFRLSGTWSLDDEDSCHKIFCFVDLISAKSAKVSRAVSSQFLPVMRKLFQFSVAYDKLHFIFEWNKQKKNQ